MSEPVAVTGASGHLGNNLVRRLLADGRQVRVVLLPDDPAPALEGLAVERVSGDVLDPDSLRSAFRGAATVFHLAGVISIAGGMGGKVDAINVAGVRNAAEAALAEGVGRFVHCSSIHAFSAEPLRRPIDERRRRPFHRGRAAYDRSKAAGEAKLADVVADGLDAVTVNPTGIIGPYDFGPSRMGKVLLMLRAGRLPVVPDGGFNWVDVRDVADALIRAEHHGQTGESYIASGHWQSLHDIAELVHEVTGARVPATISMAVARLGVPFVSFFDHRLGREPLFTAESLYALRTYRDVDHSKATRELGYMPRPTLETIEDTFRWFAEAGVIDSVRVSRPGLRRIRAWWRTATGRGVRRA